MSIIQRFKLNSFILFILFVTVLFNYLYFENKFQKRSIRLTPDMIDNMSKEELKGYIEFKERLNKNNFYLDIVITIFNFVIGLYLGYLIFYYRKFLPVNKLRYLDLLPEKEKKVLEFIIKERGKTTQYLIWKNLGLNKVEVSRIIKKLEENGKIKVDRSGKVNYVELSEDLKQLFL